MSSRRKPGSLRTLEEFTVNSCLSVLPLQLLAKEAYDLGKEEILIPIKPGTIFVLKKQAAVLGYDNMIKMCRLAYHVKCSRRIVEDTICHRQLQK
jgi:hypothetical protein